MRLIDADNFKTQVAAAAISNGFMQSSEKARVMIDLIDMQPTAFDIDKVVEKLEELAEYEKKDWQKYDEEQSFGGYCAYGRAIEIVKNNLN